MPSQGADRAELIRLLSHLVETPVPGHTTLWELIDVNIPPTPAEHTQLFVMGLVPFASVYLSDEGMIGGTARDEIAGFWRAVGRVPPPEPDHLAALLRLLADLDTGDDGLAESAMRRHAADVLISTHLSSWLGAYLLRVTDVAPPQYRTWAGIVERTVLDDAVPVDRPMPDVEQDIVRHLLSPARSGLIVTRSDLARCASDLSLGLRIGERAYALQALLDQDERRVLDWFDAMGRSWRSRLVTDSRWAKATERTIAHLADH